MPWGNLLQRSMEALMCNNAGIAYKCTSTAHRSSSKQLWPPIPILPAPSIWCVCSYPHGQIVTISSSAGIYLAWPTKNCEINSVTHNWPKKAWLLWWMSISQWFSKVHGSHSLHPCTSETPIGLWSSHYTHPCTSETSIGLQSSHHLHPYTSETPIGLRSSHHLQLRSPMGVSEVYECR